MTLFEHQEVPLDDAAESAAISNARKIVKATKVAKTWDAQRIENKKQTKKALAEEKRKKKAAEDELNRPALEDMKRLAAEKKAIATKKGQEAAQKRKEVLKKGLKRIRLP